MVDSKECDRCGRERPGEFIESVKIDEEHELCEACRENVEYKIENYYWYDRWTDKHHERLVELLENREEIDCVHGSSQSGEYVIHTPYVSSDVIQDVRDQFGLQVTAFGPRWPQDSSGWGCIDEVGPRFEVVLDYKMESKPPIPMEAPFNWLDIKYLDDNDKQF